MQAFYIFYLINNIYLLKYWDKNYEWDKKLYMIFIFCDIRYMMYLLYIFISYNFLIKSYMLSVYSLIVVSYVVIYYIS